MDFQEKIANIISLILSPVGVAFIGTIAFSFFPKNSTNSYNTFISLILGIFFLSVLPVILILYYTKKGKIDLWVSERKIRTPFYVFAIIGYIFALIIFYYLELFEMMVFTAAYLFVTISILFGNFYTKISSHTGGVTGPVIALIYIFGINAMPLIILIPMVTWSRKKLNAHNDFQLISGIVIATIVTFITYYFFYDF